MFCKKLQVLLRPVLKVIFSDEAPLQLFDTAREMIVQRRKGEL